MSYATFSGSAGTPSECRALFARVLQMSARTGMNNSAGELCDNGGPVGPSPPSLAFYQFR